MRVFGPMDIPKSKKGKCEDCGKDNTMVFFDSVEDKWFCNVCS